MIVPVKVAVMVALGAAALGFMTALALSPAVDGSESNILFVVSDSVVVTVEPVGNAE